MPDNVTFLFAAFAVVWLMFFGYFLFVGSKIGGLRQDVEALREDLATRAGEPGGTGSNPTRE